MDELEKMLLMQIADLHKVPDGAYNIRKNGEADGRRSTPHIRIEGRKDGKSGIDIFVSGETKGESVHIPVVITKTDYREKVYNDFYVEAGADVLIIAGCGIHNCGVETAEHSGVHTFHLGKGARVKYVEKHYAEGDGNGENVMNPETVMYLEEGARMEMETTQIKGVDSTARTTRATLAANADLVIREKIYTHGKQYAKRIFPCSSRATAQGRISFPVRSLRELPARSWNSGSTATASATDTANATPSSWTTRTSSPFPRSRRTASMRNSSTRLRSERSQANSF